VDAATIAWGKRYGMDGDPTTWKRFLGSAPGRFAAYTYPEARGEDLELASDMFGWFFLFDEVFDGPLRGRPQEAALFIHRMLAVLDLRTRLPEHLPPVMAAFREIWEKSKQGAMSYHWQMRAATHWAQYMWGNLAEDLDRSHHPPVSLDAYLTLRRDTIGYRPSLDMVERTSGFEVPAQVWCQTSALRLYDITTDIVILTNDVASLEKELDRGDTVNSVLLTMDSLGTSKAKALEAINGATISLADQFHETAAQVRELGDRLGLSDDERHGLERWIGGQQNWLGGHAAWYPEANRYVVGAEPVHPNDAYVRTLMYTNP